VRSPELFYDANFCVIITVLQDRGCASVRKPSSFRRARTEQPFERSQKTDRAFRFSGARHQD
jgi:hypothetical protein